MQTSAMLGLVGLGLGVGGWLMHVHCTPLTVTVYWIGLLILLGWVAVLAGIDFWATKHHYGRLRHECFLEQTKLQAELQRRRND